jgi:hypothetical protein
MSTLHFHHIHMKVFFFQYFQYITSWLVLEAHSYNSNYLGSRGKEDYGSRPFLALWNCSQPVSCVCWSACVIWAIWEV